MIQKNGIFYFPKFQPTGLTYRFSSKKFGDLSRVAPPQNLKKFCQILNISPDSIIRPKQIHSDFVKIVSAKDKRKIIDNTDGLVIKESDIYLMVVTADCVPLLFYDPVKRIVGVVHAGWKGTSQKISQKMILQFQKLDSKVEDIFVLVGPSICQKHYEVGNDVLEKFAGQKLDRFVVAKNNKYYLDLKLANLEHLIESGIKKDKIIISDFCTFEEENNFYSWRREKPNLEGEFATIIGLV